MRNKSTFLASLVIALLLSAPIAITAVVSGTITVTIGLAQTVSAVTLTNGPPNIPFAATGSCTYATCTWIQAGISGEAVSDVYADLSPMSAGYIGTFALTCPNQPSACSNYSISQDHYTDTYGTIHNFAHITTASALAGTADDDVTVNAGSVSQRLTIHRVAANGTTAIAVACGTDTTVGNALNASGANTVFLLAGTPSSPCTYNFSNTLRTTGSNQMFLGGGQSATIIDGANQNITAFGYGPAGPAGTGPDGTQYMGDAFANIKFQNFVALPCAGWDGHCPPGTESQGLTTYAGAAGSNGFGYPGPFLQITDGWVVRNSYFTGGNASNAILVQASCCALIANNQLIGLGGSGIAGAAGWTNGVVSSTNPILAIGNELGGNNTNWYAGCDGYGGGFDKFTPGNSARGTFTSVLNNYVHDNAGQAAWTDFDPENVTLQNNTMLRNGMGYRNEIQQGGSKDVQFNVFVHNGDGSANTACWGATQSHLQGVMAQGIGQSEYYASGVGVNVQNNNIVVDNTPLFQGTGIILQNTGAGNTNEVIQHNSITVRGGASGLMFGALGGQPVITGTGYDFDAYHFISGASSSAAVFEWWDDTQVVPLAQFQSTYGQETHGTIDAIDGSATGCTHVACSSAGVGSGGRPQ